MDLKTAKSYADRIVKWLAPNCDEILIAGSIRRGMAVCNDVDIVCIPKRKESKDLFGTLIESRNLVAEQLILEKCASKLKIVSGIGHDSKQCIVEFSLCQLDLWFATRETLATRLLCRTGSMSHNIWLAARAKRQNQKWNPYEGILVDGHWNKMGDQDEYVGGRLLRFELEEGIYHELGLPFIAVGDRDAQYLTERFGEA